MDARELEMGIYARLSDKRSEEQTSTSRQVQDCRSFAASKGWRVAAVYVDEGISGYKRVERPAWKALMADLESGKLDGVVSWKLDRLGRNRLDYTRLLETVEGQGRTLALVKESVDTSTPFGRVALDLLASFARLESEQIAMRTSRALEEKAINGTPHVSGQRPFGLTVRWDALVPEETELIRDAARRVLAGEAPNAVAREWNAAGITTTAGKPWRSFTLSRTLQSPHLASLRIHRGEVIGEGDWPQALDRGTHEQLKAHFASPSRRRGSGGGRARYLLSGGVLRCGLCGHQMMSRPREDKRRRYVCRSEPGTPGCGHIGILSEPLEELITEAVLLRLSSPVVNAVLRGTELDGADQQPDLAAAIRDDEEALVQLARDHATRIISRPEWFAAREVIEVRLDEAKAQIASQRRGSVLEDVPHENDALRQWWEDGDISVARRRAVLAALIARILIAPAVRGRNHFDPARVGVEWRA